MPMKVPPPGLFSTSTGWPTDCERFCPIARTVASSRPPTANGRMTWIGLLGYFCALAGVGRRTTASNATDSIELILVNVIVCFLPSSDFLCVGRAAIEQALGLALAEICHCVELPLLDQLDVDRHAKVFLESRSELLLQAVDAARILANLDMDDHLVARATGGLRGVRLAQPFAGGARVAAHGGQARHRIKVDAAQLHHVVAA